MKKESSNHEIRRAAVAILNYLSDHPAAKDSVEGIAQWWTGEKPAVVKKALALLIKEGVIEVRGERYQLASRYAAHEIGEAIEKVLRKLQDGNANK